MLIIMQIRCNCRNNLHNLSNRHRALFNYHDNKKNGKAFR